MTEDAALFMLLKLVSDSGHIGVAEVTVKPTWSGISLRSLAASVEDIFVPMLAGADLSDAAAVRNRLDGVPENASAKTLIDNACWDLRAAAIGVPLWQLWSGKAVVPLSWAVTKQSPHAMASEAAEMVERHGFGTLKVKGGQGAQTDLAGLRAIRAAVGESVRLYVDANGAYRRDEALDYVQRMTDAGAELVEDPCALLPDEEFQALQQRCGSPVLVDFGCASRRDAALFVERGARALSLKPGRFGLSDTRTMRDLALASGCITVVGLFGESALGTLTALQLAATLPQQSLPAEVTWFLAMTEQIVKEGIHISNGAVEMPRSAGLADAIDWGKLDALAVQGGAS